jgi:hypothetical protein
MQDALGVQTVVLLDYSGLAALASSAVSGTNQSKRTDSLKNVYLLDTRIWRNRFGFRAVVVWES